ncbi:uncharacterized protein L201_003963 [Kwoniella dendrophila CBS 6074]|uniref:Uncharacterized protein n=1 Tax=Kwoniella dendrophila CBS 6074 TaxID=1295534 RepID=A0AAX4JWW7_9TREE
MIQPTSQKTYQHFFVNPNPNPCTDTDPNNPISNRFSEFGISGNIHSLITVPATSNPASSYGGNKPRYRIYSTAQYFPDERRLERQTVTGQITQNNHSNITLLSEKNNNEINKVNELDRKLRRCLTYTNSWFDHLTGSQSLEEYFEVEKTIFDNLMKGDSSRTLINDNADLEVELLQLGPIEWERVTGQEFKRQAFDQTDLISSSSPSPVGDLDSQYESNYEDYGSEGTISSSDLTELISRASSIFYDNRHNRSSNLNHPYRSQIDEKPSRRFSRVGKSIGKIWKYHLSCCNADDLRTEEGNYRMVPNHSDIFE